MTVTNELIDSLLADYKKPEDLIGENGLLKLLTKKRGCPEFCVNGAIVKTLASSPQTG